MIDLIPPQAPDIERAVLGAMLIDTNAIGRAIMIVTPEIFYKPVNQTIYLSLTDLYNKNLPIDQLTVAEHLRGIGQLENVGGEVAIAALMTEATTSANIEYHCSILTEKYLLREIIQLTSSISSRCYKGNAISKEVFENLMAGMMRIRENRLGAGYSGMMETMLSATQDIESRINAGDKVSGIPMGFKRIDRIIDGCQAGDLIIIAARPSIGKSALASNIAINAASQGYGIAVFSLEMTRSKIGRRMIAGHTRLGVSNTHGRTYSGEDIKLISEAGNTLSKLPVYIDDHSGINHVNLYAKLKLMVREHDIKLVIIDHLQLMSAVNQRDDMRAWITDTTKNLKGYAKSLKLPIICLSQLSRLNEKENREPRLSDLRESGTIEQDADIVMFIHNPKPDEIVKSMSKLGKYVTESEAENIRELIIRKNREGETGKIFLFWQKEITRFDDLDY